MTQIGVLAEVLDAPAGWPFVPWAGSASMPPLVVARSTSRFAAELRRVAQHLENIASDADGTA